MPSWYKKSMEACQWNNSNKKQIPTKNKLFENLECQKQCEDLNNFSQKLESPFLQK